MDSTNIVGGIQCTTTNTCALFITSTAVVNGAGGHPGSGGKSANVGRGTNVAGVIKRTGGSTSHPAGATANAGIAKRGSGLDADDRFSTSPAAGTHVDAGNCCIVIESFSTSPAAETHVDAGIVIESFSTTPRISPAIEFTTEKTIFIKLHSPSIRRRRACG